VESTVAQRAPQPSIYVSIVSGNPETLDGLQAYFGESGVASRCSGTVKNVDVVAPRCATAAVIFPDDFADRDMLALMQQLRRARPRLLALLVTRKPQRFVSILQADGRSRPPIVLPKPSFGWDILDAIGAHSTQAEA
jgi:hypothetical protein